MRALLVFYTRVRCSPSASLARLGLGIAGHRRCALLRRFRRGAIVWPRSCTGCGLTIRSSGPLRRVAALSCGGQQRRLNSSVRPQRALLILGALLTAFRFGLRARRASFVCTARPACSFANSRAQTVVADPARISARHARHARVAGVQRARPLQFIGCFGMGWCRHRRPSPLRAVAALSSQRYCLAKVVHWVRPNYSFKRTAATGRGTIMRRSAAAA
jgi:hypothetical protein